MFNNPLRAEIPLLWHWAFVYRSSPCLCTPSYPQSALQHPLQSGEGALPLLPPRWSALCCWGHLLQHSLPSLSWDIPQLPWHLRCLWFLLQGALCPCLLMCFPAMSVRSGKAPTTNSVQTSLLRVVLPGEISLHFSEAQPLYEV